MKTSPVLTWIVHRALGLGDPGVPPDAEWSAALPAVSVNRLSPLAAWYLGAQVATLPEPVRLGLERDIARAKEATARGGAQLAELAGAMDGCDCPWVILKGLPLAHRLYPDPVCRPSRDLDLLVPRHCLDGAASRLAQLGYQQTPEATSYHRKFIRPGTRGWTEMVELHWNAGMRGRGAPTAETILATRTRTMTPWGEVWVPDALVERELLIRHWIRHGGWQLILLLDLLLHLGDAAPVEHLLGAPLADDQRRLGLTPRIQGPASLATLPLRRWLAKHDFAERRLARRPAALASALAEQVSAGEWGALIRHMIWPRTPSPRWESLARRPLGRPTWRWYRLLTLGKGR